PVSLLWPRLLCRSRARQRKEKTPKEKARYFRHVAHVFCKSEDTSRHTAAPDAAHPGGACLFMCRAGFRDPNFLKLIPRDGPPLVRAIPDTVSFLHNSSNGVF